MANLFSLPTPQEVRQHLRGGLFDSINQQQYGGLNAGMNRAFANLGGLFGSMLAPESAAERKAANAQDIAAKVQQEWQAKGGVDTKDINQLAAYGQQLAGELFTHGLQAEGMQILGKVQGLKPDPAEDPFKDFLKEERKTASATVKSIDTRAATIRGSFGKLQRLNKQAKTAKQGTTEQRSAINSMIANVVRLNSPGIVSEQELKTYTGGQGTTAALLGLLQGKGVNVDAWAAGIDASGNADPDALLRIGQNLILGEAAPLFDQYDDARNRAERAEMSPRAQKTIFGGNKNIESLRSLTKAVGDAPNGVPPAVWNQMPISDRQEYLRLGNE